MTTLSAEEEAGAARGVHQQDVERDEESVAPIAKQASGVRSNTSRIQAIPPEQQISARRLRAHFGVFHPPTAAVSTSASFGPHVPGS